jgi:predicted metal-dependent peptidase
MAIWEKLTPEQKIQCANVDIMGHERFGIVGAFGPMGRNEITERIPTAATDGVNKFYNPNFIKPMSRHELRYLVVHELLHIALKHCLLYREHMADPQLRRLSAMAADYVVNDTIETTDPELVFVHRPVQTPPLIEKKYHGWSYPMVFNDLYRQAKKGGKGEGEGEGEGGGGVALGEGNGGFDEHEPSEMTDEQVQKMGKVIANALEQGKIACQRMAAERGLKGTGGALDLDNLIEPQVDWAAYVREFFNSVVKGSDQARWTRINTRLWAASGGRVVLPTLWDEVLDEIVIAPDTSGSMYGYYDMVFTEVASIMTSLKPKKLHILWWDTTVANHQVFTDMSALSDLNAAARLLKPAGGGGTSPNVVREYMKQHNIKPQAVLWITDGEIGPCPQGIECKQLWCVINNRSFNANTGKTLHITHA